MTGEIVTLNDRGFGFLKPAEGNAEKHLFFHSKELVGVLYDELKVGDLVEFDLVQGPKGPVAVNVGLSEFVDSSWKADKVEPETDHARLVMSEFIEGFCTLTPDLIQHLRRRNDDIEKVDPNVFEHLIGELMISAGWDQVRLVGRNPQTQADIFALHYVPSLGGVATRLSSTRAFCQDQYRRKGIERQGRRAEVVT